MFQSLLCRKDNFFLFVIFLTFLASLNQTLFKSIKKSIDCFCTTKFSKGDFCRGISQRTQTLKVSKLPIQTKLRIPQQATHPRTYITQQHLHLVKQINPNNLLESHI